MNELGERPPLLKLERYDVDLELALFIVCQFALRVDELLLLAEGFGDTTNLLLGWLLILILDRKDQVCEAIEHGVKVILEVMDQPLPHDYVGRIHLGLVQSQLELDVDHVPDSAGKRIRVVVDTAHAELIVQVC